MERKSVLRAGLRSLGCGAVLASLLAIQPAMAQSEWPTRPVTLIAPFAPGGSTDMLARVIARALTDELGQPVLVENHGGAGGTLGAGIAANAEPDGYTILLSNVTMGSADAIYQGLPYDFETGFNHVAYLGYVPCVLVASNSLPVESAEEFLDHLQAHPDELNYGSSGIGAASHLCTQSFLTAGGFEATHIPYLGAGPMMVDITSGAIDFALDTAASAASQIKGGNVRGLAVSSSERVPLLEDLPTLEEAGLPFEMSIWYGLVTPAGTPEEVNGRLYEATRNVLSYPEVEEAYLTLGAILDDRTSEAFLELVRADKERWTQIVQDAGIEPN